MTKSPTSAPIGGATGHPRTNRVAGHISGRIAKLRSEVEDLKATSAAKTEGLTVAFELIKNLIRRVEVLEES